MFILKHEKHREEKRVKTNVACTEQTKTMSFKLKLRKTFRRVELLIVLWKWHLHDHSLHLSPITGKSFSPVSFSRKQICEVQILVYCSTYTHPISYCSHLQQEKTSLYECSMLIAQVVAVVPGANWTAKSVHIHSTKYTKGTISHVTDVW